MKKRMLALLLILVLILACGCQKATLDGYKLYRSTPLGFSVEYPDFWQKSADVKKGIAVFVSPAEGYSDDYTENLSVQEFVPDVTGEDVLNSYVKGYVANLEATVKNYKLVSETDTTLAGETAYQIVYETQSDDETDQMRLMQIFSLHEGKIYVLTYAAEFSGYSYFMTYVEKMISTFKFL